jgi:hypothetical protein
MVDNMDEPTLPDASDMNGTTAIGTADASDDTQSQNGANDTGGAGRGAARPTLMSGLATAMREAAVRERERISAIVAEDAANHIEKVRSRAAVESDELRRLAEEDVERIEQWSASEIERVRSEAARKVDDRRSSLDEYLKQHDSIIDTEIDGVAQAVREYESTLDRFFAELGGLSDPSEIVRRAGLLPPSPDLDEVRATARADAMARYSEAAPGDPAETTGSSEAVVVESTEAAAEAEPAQAVGEVAELAEAEAAAQASPEPVLGMAAEGPSETTDTGAGGAMSGVMDDGSGSIESGESIESPQVEIPEAKEAPVLIGETESSTEPTPEPVGVMDPDARRTPAWPAPVPTPEPVPIAPTIDNTSAAVRLLRSVAPWTAPTRANEDRTATPE